MKPIHYLLLTLILMFGRVQFLSAQWIQTSGLNGNVRCFAASGAAIFAATSGTDSSGVFMSTDSGMTWRAVHALNTGLNTTYVYALAAPDTNFFAGTNAGVFLSTNDGTSWTALNTGLTNIYVYALAAIGTNLFAGTYGGGVFKSTNNGESWVAVNNGLTNSFVNALAVVEDSAGHANVFAGTDGGGVFVSGDSGSSWLQVNNGLASADVQSLSAFGNELFAGNVIVAFGGGISVSNDNGATWTSLNSGLPMGSMVNCFANSSGSVFAGCAGVFMLSNNGTSWTPVNSGLPTTGVYALDVSGPYLLAGTDYGVWRRALSEISSPPIINLSSLAIAFGQVRIHSASVDTLSVTDISSSPLMIDSVYASTRWFTVSSVHDTLQQRDTLKLPIAFTPDTAKSYLDTLYILSNSSVPLTKVPLSGDGTLTSVRPTLAGLPQAYQLSQNYPNPFNPSTIISYDIPTPCHVKLIIYDVLGRQVAELVNDERAPGYYQTLFTAKALPSGVYFYTIEAGTYHDTKKFLLLK